jgi:hypothetical protein
MRHCAARALASAAARPAESPWMVPSLGLRAFVLPTDAAMLELGFHRRSFESLVTHELERRSGRLRSKLV